VAFSVNVTMKNCNLILTVMGSQLILSYANKKVII